MNKHATRTAFEWVSIQNVFPNSLNPRRDDAIKTTEIQSILKKQGWEEPLTVYKNKKNYILLAGHRRLHAAKQLGMKEVPVYVVDRPQNKQEEIERISSLQQGRVNWTPFEWAESTYNKWIVWGKPNLTSFSKKVNMNRATVGYYISVMTYYRRGDIEDKLQNGTYGITQLAELVEWMDEFKKHKPDLLNQLDEKIVLEIMLRKIEDGRARRDELKKRNVLELASEEELISFLNTSKYSLSDLLNLYDLNKKAVRKNFHGSMVSLGRLKNSVSDFEIPNDKELKQKYLKSLEEAITLLKRKSDEITQSEVAATKE